MLRSIYIAAGGMSGRADAIDVLSNNLANVNTNGYKADKLATRSFAKMLLSRVDDLLPGMMANATNPPRIGHAELAGGATESRYIDFTPGNITFTENPLDLALDGPGFFTLEDANGQIFFTRDGTFTISSDGYLVNQGGLRVLDAADIPVQIFGQGEIRVDADGSIAIGGLPAGILGISEFNDLDYIQKAGHNLLSADVAAGRVPAAATEVIQGAVEGSNVNPIHALTQLISRFREFEAASRTLEVIDRTLDRVINEAGRLSQ